MALKVETILHRLVYELRYSYGFTYLDKCGLVVTEILKSSPGWHYQEADPRGSGVVHNPDMQMTFSFGINKLSLTQSQSREVEQLDVSEFGRYADFFSEIVCDALATGPATRVGLRMWNFVPCSSQEEAQKKIESLKILSIPEDLPFSQIEDRSFTLVAELGSKLVRIAVVGGEQEVVLDQATIDLTMKKAARKARKQKKALIQKLKAQKRVSFYPEFMVIIDTDFFVDDPPYPDNLSISEFVSDSIKQGNEIASNLASRMI